MSGGLRARGETQLFSSKGTALTVGGSPFTIVAAAALVGVQRAAIYHYRIQALAGAATYQFQDTGGNILSAQYSLAIGQIDRDNLPAQGDPLWQATLAGLGLQLLLTGTGPVAADIWWAAGA